MASHLQAALPLAERTEVLRALCEERLRRDLDSRHVLQALKQCVAPCSTQAVMLWVIL